jgi:hypothetical protein
MDGVTTQKTKSETKIEATYFCKMFVSTNKITLCQNSKDHSVKDQSKIMVVVTSSSETLVSAYKTKWGHSPEDHILDTNHRENIKT